VPGEIEGVTGLAEVKVPEPQLELIAELIAELAAELKR
jgi:hypothetical protein